MSQLIVVAGPPCSGKSTLARLIAAPAGAVLLDVDEIRHEILPGSCQAQEDRNCAYRCMHLAARKLVDGGVGRIVLAATYARQEPRYWLATLIDAGSIDAGFLQCQVDPDLAATRFRARAPGHAALDLTEQLVRRQASEYAYGAGVLLDTRKSIAECFEDIERALREGQPFDRRKWVEKGAA